MRVQCGRRHRAPLGWWQWAASILFVLGASPVMAQSYYLEDLGTLGGSTSAAQAINDRGDVVGWALASASRGTSFQWSNGVIQDLLPSGSYSSAATTLNNTGQAAGWYQYDGGARSVWVNELPSQPTPPQSVESWASGINDAKQVVGAAVLDRFGTTHALLWSFQSPTPGSGGFGGNSRWVSRDLDTLGGRNSQANAINAAGLVVGSSSTTTGEEHAFQWTKDGMKDLGTLGGATSAAYAVNSADPVRVVGVSATKTGEQHACQWSQGQVTDLSSLPNCPESVAYGINDAGQIVGTVCPDGDASSERAFLYIDDRGMIDLNNSIFEGLGWHLSEARGINNKGQIVGWGTRNGQQHAFRLSPLPPTDSIAP